jgi:hypothetical protein
VALCLFLVVSFAHAFVVKTPISFRTTTRLCSTTDGVISVERTAQRDIGSFQEWAVQCGVQMAPDGGFYLAPGTPSGSHEGDESEQEQFFAATATGGEENSCLLYVPGEMILSASRVAQDLEEYLSPRSLQMLEERGLSHLYPQFLLFVKVLLEYEQGVESPYYPWMAALPRKWNTAASMDDFCLSCLPPYIKKLCHEERHQLAIFAQALRFFEYVSDESKANQKLLEFAYNVVFTRAFPDNDSGDLKIVPMADVSGCGVGRWGPEARIERVSHYDTHLSFILSLFFRCWITAIRQMQRSRTMKMAVAQWF